MAYSRENGSLEDLPIQNDSQASDGCPECKSINGLRWSTCNHRYCINCKHFFSASVCPPCRVLNSEISNPCKSECRNRETQCLTNVQYVKNGPVTQTSNLTPDSRFPLVPYASIVSQGARPKSNNSSIPLANGNLSFGAIGSEKKLPLRLPHEFETGLGARSKQPVNNSSSSHQLSKVENYRSKERPCNESMNLSATLPQKEYQSSNTLLPNLQLNQLVQNPSNCSSSSNFQSNRKEISCHEGLPQPVKLSPKEYRSSNTLNHDLHFQKSVPIPSNSSSSSYQSNSAQSLPQNVTLSTEEYQLSNNLIPNVSSNKSVPIPSNDAPLSMYQSNSAQNYSRKETRCNESLSLPKENFLSSNAFNSNLHLNPFAAIPSDESSSSSNYQSSPIPSNGSSFSYQSATTPSSGSFSSNYYQSTPTPSTGSSSNYYQSTPTPSTGSSSNYRSAPILSNGYSSFNYQSNGAQSSRENEIQRPENLPHPENCPPVHHLASSSLNYVLPRPVPIPEISPSHNIVLSSDSSSSNQFAPIPLNGSSSFNYQYNGAQRCRTMEIQRPESLPQPENCPPVHSLASSSLNYILPRPVPIPEISPSHNIVLNSDVPKCCINNPKSYCISCEMVVCSVCQETHIKSEHKFRSLEDYYRKIEKDFQEIIQALKHNNDEKYNFAMKEDKETRKGLTNQVNATIQEIQSETRDLRDEIRARGEILHKQVDTKIVPYFTNLNVMCEEMKPSEEPQILNFFGKYSYVINKCQEMTSNEEGLMGLTEDDKMRRSLSSWGAIENDSKPATTEAYGQALKDLILKQKTYFYIECKNHSGDRTTCKEEDLEVFIIYPNYIRKKVNISFNHDFYQGFIETDQKGQHAINIILRGMNIHCSEYKVNTIQRKIPNGIYNDITNIKNFQFPLSLKRGWGICCSKDGLIYVTDKNDHCIWVFNSEMQFLHQFGRGGSGDGEFRVPCGITIDDDNRIIVADKDNHRIQVLSRYGKFILSFGRYGKLNGMFHYPWDVATNSRLEIAVTDFTNNRIQLFNKNGMFLFMYDFSYDRYNSYKSGNVKDSSPRGICFYGNNDLFVTEFYRRCVYHLSISRDRDRISLIRKIKFSEHIQRPIEKIQGIIIADNCMFIAEAKYCRIIMIPMYIILMDISPQHYINRNHIIHSDDMKIMAKEKGNFFPSNLTVSPDGTLIAIHHKEGILYTLN